MQRHRFHSLGAVFTPGSTYGNDIFIYYVKKSKENKLHCFTAHNWDKIEGGGGCT